MENKPNLDKIWKVSHTSTVIDGREEIIENENHATYYANNLGGKYQNTLKYKLEDFMSEIFIYEGLPNEGIKISPKGLIEKGIIQPYFKQALEKRLRTNGCALIVKYGALYYAVSYTATSWDKDFNAITYQIVEPFSKLLNGRTDLDFVEVRNNWDKVSDSTKINPIMTAIQQTWELMIEEINVILPKKLYNRSIINDTDNNKTAMENIYKSKKSMIGFDMKSIADANSELGTAPDLFYDFVFENVSERLLMKMDFYLRELFKALGLPINASHDKKGENLTTAEVEMENLIGSSQLIHRKEMRDIAIEKCGMKWPEWKGVSLSFRTVEDFQIFQKVESELQKRGDDESNKQES